MSGHVRPIVEVPGSRQNSKHVRIYLEARFLLVNAFHPIDDRGAERAVTAVASLHFFPPSLVRGVPKTKQRIKCTHELVDWVKHLTN